MASSSSFLPGVRFGPAKRRALLLADYGIDLVYDDGPLFGQVYGFLARHAFAPIAFEGVLDDASTGHMLQVDGIFHRATDEIDPGAR